MHTVGILGGTFDPPHIGHMMIAKEVQLTCGFDEIWFIPTNDPPHKQHAHARASDRLAMLEEMIQDEPTWKVLDIELKREGKSFTIDTLTTLRRCYPEITFHFIIGADMVEYLPKWYKIDELITLVSFICVQRDTYSLETNYPVKEVYVPEVHISSTLIRQWLAQGKSPHYFVSEYVFDYIKEHQLYGYSTNQRKSTTEPK
ncbi:MAG TPA: nicotinate-nucleotide adenylyltransferase [Virgibacillus sp.]|nr:nicotinate-nucleotide adenylyltransferase [Virgibacillus sp.]